MHKNKLTEIPFALYRLNLEKLNLGGNKISFIDNEVLESLDKLKYLTLSRNQLKIFPGSFPLPVSLTKVIISNNAIKTLPDVRYLKNLKTFSVNHNQLSALPSLPASIRVFTACNNYLNSSFSVAELTNLKFLDISNNPNMGHVSKQTFSTKSSAVHGSLRIRWLLMKNCGLKAVDEKVLNCLAHLHYVDISNNGIEEYNRKWFIGSRKINAIKLAGNNFKCSCQLKEHINKINEFYTAKADALRMRKKNNVTFTNDFDKVTCVLQDTGGIFCQVSFLKVCLFICFFSEIIPLKDYTSNTTCEVNFTLKKYNPCAHQSMYFLLIW